MSKMPIERFIWAFKNMRCQFLHGFCYWFAVILRERFGGYIEYHPIRNHFATRIGDGLWDASGSIPSDGFEPWESYKRRDQLHTERIERDCINYDGGPIAPTAPAPAQPQPKKEEE